MNDAKNLNEKSEVTESNTDHLDGEFRQKAMTSPFGLVNADKENKEFNKTVDYFADQFRILAQRYKATPLESLKQVYEIAETNADYALQSYHKRYPSLAEKYLYKVETLQTEVYMELNTYEELMRDAKDIKYLLVSKSQGVSLAMLRLNFVLLSVVLCTNLLAFLVIPYIDGTQRIAIIGSLLSFIICAYFIFSKHRIGTFDRSGINLLSLARYIPSSIILTLLTILYFTIIRFCLQGFILRQFGSSSNTFSINIIAVIGVSIPLLITYFYRLTIFNYSLYSRRKSIELEINNQHKKLTARQEELSSARYQLNHVQQALKDFDFNKEKRKLASYFLAIFDLEYHNRSSNYFWADKQLTEILQIKQTQQVKSDALFKIHFNRNFFSNELVAFLNELTDVYSKLSFLNFFLKDFIEYKTKNKLTFEVMEIETYQTNLLPEFKNLKIEKMAISSPGFWEVLGSFNPLSQIRDFLNDRHNRKKDLEFRNRQEEKVADIQIQRQEFELNKDKEKKEIELMLLKFQLTKEAIGVIQMSNLPDEKKIEIVEEFIITPLFKLASFQDSGLISIMEKVEQSKSGQK